METNLTLLLFEPKAKAGAPRDAEVAINKLSPITAEGFSGWIEREDIARHMPEATRSSVLPGNGSSIFNKDRGLGRYYEIQKDGESPSQFTAVRLAGYASAKSKARSGGVPSHVRNHFKDSRCVFCGSKHQHVDHKDGRKDTSNGVDDQCCDSYQSTCVQHNLQKRTACNDCEVTGKRFDARNLGYTVGWSEGSERYRASKQKCKGCYYYDPIEFRSHFVLKAESP